MKTQAQRSQPSIYDRLKKVARGLRDHAIYEVVFFIAGALVYSYTTFKNETFMREGTTIGPPFETNLLFIKAQSLTPVCSFEAGDYSQDIPRDQEASVGDYEVHVVECDSEGKFAVLDVRKKGGIYKVTNSIWALLHLN